MKKRTLRIILSVLIIGLVVRYVFPDLLKPSTVRAVGDLVINFHVPEGDPIFVVENMLPGDDEDRDVDVHNGGTIPRMVAVKGIRTGGTGADPLLETVLDIVISDGLTPLYGSGSPTGSKTLEDFFTDSNTGNGVQLNVINPGGDKTYNFLVTFPTGAGNDFENKSVIFDLTFGVITGNDVLINEVYYLVDGTHGLDSPADRGITAGGLNLSIIGNGAGSVNQIFVDIENNCTIYQVNNTNVNNNLDINQNTGGNNANNNTGGDTNINSGSASANVSITNIGNVNKASCTCNNKCKNNHEWVELFNPTDHDVNLKNYTLTDNSGLSVKISGNKILQAGKFALLSRNNTTWSFWNEPSGVLKIALNKQIGDGLNNAGDHLILENHTGTELDRMSWGTDTSGFTPPALNPVVALGASTERLVPGYDTDTVSDWEPRTPPTPGN